MKREIKILKTSQSLSYLLDFNQSFCLPVYNMEFLSYSGINLSKWSKKGICLPIWWDRCCKRCKVKSYLLTFIKFTFIFSCVWFLVCTWNIFSVENCHIIHLHRVISKLGWYSKGLNFINGFMYFQLWVCLP